MSGLRGVARLGSQFFEPGSAGARLLRQEPQEWEFRGRQAARDQGAERGIGSGDWDDGDAGRDGFLTRSCRGR